VRYFIFILAMLLYSALNLNCGFWKYNNAFVGNHYNIAVKDSNTFYVIGNSQIRARCEYTEDEGKSWVNIIPDSIAYREAITKTGHLIAQTVSYFKENDYDVLLIGCAGDTIIRSTDNGLTWQRLCLHANNNQILSIKRLNKNFYYCYTENSFSISEDYGITWENINIPIDLSKHELLLEATAITDSLYVIVTKKVYTLSSGTYIRDFTYKSSDKGINWTEYKINSNPNYLDLTSKIVQVPNNQLLYYFLIFQDTTNYNVYSNFYKSSDNGKNWEFIDTNFHILTDTYIVFKNEFYGYKVNNSKQLLCTKDGGLTWSQDFMQYSITEIQNIAFLNEYKSLLLTTDELYIKDDRVTSITDISPILIEISPNPAGDFITINLGANSVGAINPMLKHGVDIPSDIVIYNTLGENMTTPSLLGNATPPKVGNFRIDISNLPKGMYFVRMGGEIAKFVKM